MFSQGLALGLLNITLGLEGRNKSLACSSSSLMNGKKFYDIDARAAQFFVEKDQDFDLASPEVSAMFIKSEQLFPIEKAGL